jgi:hypothetical protein
MVSTGEFRLEQIFPSDACMYGSIPLICVLRKKQKKQNVQWNGKLLILISDGIIINRDITLYMPLYLPLE